MIKNSFDIGPESWHSYDYHAFIVSGAGFMVLTNWQKDDGVNNSGYVWAHQAHWSTDVPEQPISILPLIFYRRWIGKEPIDLREATVSVYLRGDDLQLYGAACYFWALSPGTRWHLTSQPLEIADGRWAAEPNRFSLKNDESLWHCSYNSEAHWHDSYPPGGPNLDIVLTNTWSYGFSFVGFTSEVHGKLSMDEFEIVLPGE